MNIPINLSSDPFRRDRPFLLAAWTLGAILTAMLAALVYLGVATNDENLEARIAAGKAQAALDKLNNEQSRLEGTLRRAENGEVIERSVFLNQLLLRKGISWTRIFADLEKVMPHNVRLIQIRPQVTPDNQIFLEMVVGAESSPPVLDMLMKLESSPQFGATHVNNFLPPSQTEPLYRYRVSVNYAQKL